MSDEKPTFGCLKLLVLSAVFIACWFALVGLGMWIIR